MTVVDATTLASGIDTPVAGEIARSVGAAVAAGDLRPGDHLPTVRSLARELGVSPSTVSDAWRILRERGLIDTDRRRGTTVRSPASAADGRSWHVPVRPGTLDLDLSTGTPDADLLPSLAATLDRIQLDLGATSYLDEPVVPGLSELLVSQWPFPAEAMTIVDGAQDALDRIIATVVRFGDRVIVEDPTFPPLLDLLDLAGATVIGVRVGAEGIDPSGVEAALSQDPVAMFVQPRAHNPTGAGLSGARAVELADLLRPTDVIIVEDDHSGAVAGAALHSIGAHLPGQTVHIRSYSKSHGPDLRIAAIGGAAGPIEAVVRRRQLGPSWTSRLLQRVLLDLLCDETTTTAVAVAEATYTERRAALIAALQERDVDVAEGGSGLNLWVPVDDDRDAVVALAANGIGVAPGEPFEVARRGQRHIRLTLSTDIDHLGRLADTIATAAGRSPDANPR